eukprot:m.164372 g.164372  ORF g.164372 m.164372 type:complete len:84 (+) comp24940_c2_seq6:217-468(+)
MSDSKLDSYMQGHIAPGYVGPDGLYITDHHHTFMGLSIAETHFKTGYITIQGNFASLSKQDFISKLLALNKVSYSPPALFSHI